MTCPELIEEFGFFLEYVKSLIHIPDVWAKLQNEPFLRRQGLDPQRQEDNLAQNSKPGNYMKVMPHIFSHVTRL